MQALVRLFCLCCVNGVMAFPDGAVEGSCESMFPNHSDIQPQPSSSPYTISVNSSTFTPGLRITVILQAAENDSEFQGFMLQAREVGEKTAVGRFILINTIQSRALNCFNIQNSTLSQASGGKKAQFEATWEAPANSSLGDIQFCVTFVQNYNVFWTMVTSPTIRSTINSQLGSTLNSGYKNILASMLQLNFILIALTAELL